MAGRLGGQQHLGVVVLRIGEDRFRAAPLDHLARAASPRRDQQSA